MKRLLAIIFVSVMFVSFLSASVYSKDTGFSKFIFSGWEKISPFISGNAIIDPNLGIMDTVSACGVLDIPNTIYALTQDVTSTGTCFTFSAENITLDCQNFRINYSTSAVGNGANVLANATNTTILNCTIVKIGSTNSGPGIVLASSFNTIKENNITILGGFSNHVISLSSGSSNNYIANNWLKGVTNSNGLVLTGSNNNNTLENNTIIENVGNHVSLSINSGSRNNTIRGNTISLNGNQPTVFMGSGSNDNNFLNNIISSSGSSGSLALTLSSANGSTFINNNFTTSGNSAYAVGLTGGSSYHNFTSNYFAARGSNGISINMIQQNLDNILDSNTLFTTQSYIGTASTSLGNNLTNNTFEQNSGSVRFLPTATIPASMNVNMTRLNISSNSVALNSSVYSFLNVSAVITFNNLSFTNPQPLVDFQDDGSFEICLAPQCNEISYNSTTGTFIFNVSGFTTYRSNETPDSLAPNILIESPENTTYSNATQIVNLTVSDNVAVDTVWVSNGTDNETYTAPFFKLFNEGSNTLEVYANDSSGNVNSTESVTFSISTITSSPAPSSGGRRTFAPFDEEIVAAPTPAPSPSPTQKFSCISDYPEEACSAWTPCVATRQSRTCSDVLCGLPDRLEIRSCIPDFTEPDLAAPKETVLGNFLKGAFSEFLQICRNLWYLPGSIYSSLSN